MRPGQIKNIKRGTRRSTQIQRPLFQKKQSTVSKLSIDHLDTLRTSHRWQPQSLGQNHPHSGCSNAPSNCHPKSESSCQVDLCSQQSSHLENPLFLFSNTHRQTKVEAFCPLLPKPSCFSELNVGFDLKTHPQASRRLNIVRQIHWISKTSVNSFLLLIFINIPLIFFFFTKIQTYNSLKIIDLLKLSS